MPDFTNPSNPIFRMEKPSSARIALKWGLIAGVINIVYTVVLIAIDKYQDPSLNALNFVFGIAIAIGVLVYAMREFRTLNGGYMSFGQGLGVGALSSAVSGVVAGLFNFIYLQFIDPTVTDKMMDRVRDEWERNGMSESQMEQAEQFTSIMMRPGTLFVITVFGALIMGVILSLVLAAILRREKPVFE